MLELTSENFATETASGVALVDFWAEWCGPCKMLTPVIDELAADFAGKATVGKVNVDSERDLAAKFRVQGIPAIFILKDGDVVQTFVGTADANKASLAAALTAALEG